MVVLENLMDGFYLKSRPDAYESDGMTVGGNKGYVLAQRPKSYPITSQQKKVRDVAHECGIKTGMSRKDLRTAMVDCVGPKMRK